MWIANTNTQPLCLTSSRSLVLARIVVVLFGILLPYLARLPGVYMHGTKWITSYFGDGFPTLIFLSAFEAINWGAIVLGTLFYRSVFAIVVAALIGFAWPAYAHAQLDLSADAQAAVALIFIPIYSLPYVGLGWVLGWFMDRLWCRQAK